MATEATARAGVAEAEVIALPGGVCLEVRAGAVSYANSATTVRLHPVWYAFVASSDSPSEILVWLALCLCPPVVLDLLRGDLAATLHGVGLLAVCVAVWAYAWLRRQDSLIVVYGHPAGGSVLGQPFHVSHSPASLARLRRAALAINRGGRGRQELVALVSSRLPRGPEDRSLADITLFASRVLTAAGLLTVYLTLLHGPGRTREVGAAVAMSGLAGQGVGWTIAALAPTVRGVVDALRRH